MSEEFELLRARLEYESNADEARTELDAFMDSVKQSLSGLGRFETEVQGFGSALELAFESPRRPAIEFFSMLRLGFDEIKRGAPEAATGIGLIAEGLGGLAQRIGPFRSVVPILNNLSSVAGLVSKAFAQIQQLTQGLHGDARRLTRTMSDLGEQLVTQSDAWKILHQQRVEGAKESVRLAKADIRVLIQMEAPIEALVEARKKLVLATGNLNRVMRVETVLLRESRSHIMGARTALRRLLNDFEATGEIAETRLADAGRAVRLLEQDIIKMRQAGMKVPTEMTNTLRELGRAMDWTGKQAKKQEEETEKLTETQRRYNAAAKDSSKINKVTAASYVGVANNMTMVSRSLGAIHPSLTIVANTVQIFGRQFRQYMQVASSATATAADKIRVSMNLVNGVLIGVGAAAIALIKKTGMIATEVTTLGVTMRQVARNLALKAGADVQKFVDYVDKIPESLKGITTREALVATTSFLRGVPQLLGRIQELAKAAKNFGVTIADMSSSEVFGRFNKFIQSGNSALLKRLNIVRTADQMHQDFADTLGIAKEELTAQQKIQARFEGVLAEVALTAGVYEKAMLTAGKQLSSMKRLAEEAALVLGRQFEPVIAKIIFGVNQVLDWFIKLSPAIHKFIGSAVLMIAKLSAVATAMAVIKPLLVFIVPFFVSLAAALKPAAIALFLLKKILFSLVSKVVINNLDKIREAFKKFSDMLKENFTPIIKEFQYWWGIIKTQLEEIGILIRDLVMPILTSFFELITRGSRDSSDAWGQAFAIIKDVVVGTMMAVSDVLTAVIHLLRGEFPQAAKMMESAIVNALTTVAIVFKNTIAKAAVWGWNLIVEFANGVMRAAQQVMVKAAEFVGKIIGWFFKPGSPPLKGPLSHIVEWGKGIMETFLRSFGLADFGVLRDIMAPIQQALQGAVAAGTLKETELIPTIQNVRRSVAQLLSEFRKTGQINEEVMQGISDTLGEGGKDITEYVRRLLDHEKALRALADVGKEVGLAEKAGFVPAELKKKQQAAQEEVNLAEEALNWQKEFIAAQQESVDLQLRQLAILEKMAEAMKQIAGKEGEAVALEAKLELDFPDVEEGAGIFDDLKKTLGQTSAEFEEMRKKIQGFVDAVKAFIQLPFSEKLTVIGTWIANQGAAFLAWLEDVTGIDWQPLIDGIAELDFSKILAWFSATTGFDLLQWAKDTFGVAWNWIVEKTQWLSDTLVGESIIPDMVDKINEELGKVADIEGGSTTWWASLTERLNMLKMSLQAAWAGIEPWLAPIIAGLLLIPQAIAEVIDGLKQGFDEAGPDIKEALSGLGEAFSELWDSLKELWVTVWPILKPILIALGVALYAAFGIVSALMVGVVSGISDFVAGIVKALPGIITALSGFVNIVTGIIGLITAAFKFLTGDADGAQIAFQESIEKMREGAQKIWTGILSALGNFAAGLITGILRAVTRFGAVLGGWIIDILTSLGILDEGAREAWDAMMLSVQTTVDQIGLILTTWVSDAVAIFQGLMDQVVVIWGALFGDGAGNTGFIVAWVKKAVESVIAWVTTLWTDLVGKSIFQDISDDISKIWSDIFGEDGFILTGISDAVAAVLAFATDMKGAGAEIINSLFSGIKSAWDKGAEVLGKAWAWFQDQLPGSEPKDPRSPFHGLEKRGAAIWENVLKGMGSVDISGAFSNQMANATAGLASVQNNRNLTVTGGIHAEFPGVTSPESAGGVWGEINDQIDRAAALSNFRSGG